MASIRDACEEHLVAIKHVETSANRLNDIGMKLKVLVDKYDVWSSLESDFSADAKRGVLVGNGHDPARESEINQQFEEQES